MKRKHAKLQCEFLEARMLLSGVDIPTAVSIATIKDSAIQTNDSHITVNLDASGQDLVITGPAQGNLTLDLDQLPTGIAVLQISSFGSVTLTGEHSFYSVILDNITDVDAGHVTIGTGTAGGLWALGVQHIKIDTAPYLVVLAGADSQVGVGGHLTMGDKTLLEAGQFADDGTIYSNLADLGLMTSSPVNRINLVTENPNEFVLLNFQTLDPRDLVVSGYNDHNAQIGVVTGDFTRYFLASPTERTNLEQEQLVTLKPAVTNSVPLSSLLSDPNIASALQGVLENGASQEAVRQHALTEIRSAETAEVLFPPANSSVTDTAITQKVEHHGSDIGLAASHSSPIEPAGYIAKGVENITHLSLELAATELNAATHAIAHFDGAFTTTIYSTAARLSAPFANLVADLRTHLTTFGDIMTARVADHLMIEYQYPLLIDARPIRPSTERELLVVSI